MKKAIFVCRLFIFTEISLKKASLFVRHQALLFFAFISKYLAKQAFPSDENLALNQAKKAALKEVIKRRQKVGRLRILVVINIEDPETLV